MGGWEEEERLDVVDEERGGVGEEEEEGCVEWVGGVEGKESFPSCFLFFLCPGHPPTLLFLFLLFLY